MDFQLSEVLPALEKNAVISSLSEVIQSGVTVLMHDSNGSLAHFFKI
jgi:hypothetical protein